MYRKNVAQFLLILQLVAVNLIYSMGSPATMGLPQAPRFAISQAAAPAATEAKPEFQPTTPLEKAMETTLKRAEQFHDIPAVLLTLKLLTEDAILKGQAAPSYNLCILTKPGTDLYCQKNIAIPRIKMPQLSGKARPGSQAANKLPDKYGVVHGEDEFMNYLKEKGIAITDQDIPASQLKATQNELIGSKVSAIWWALKDVNNPEHQWVLSPIFVSQDHYILDGHHRWAAIVANDLESGQFGQTKMKTRVINMPIHELVQLANEFADQFGILQEAG